MSSMIVAGAVLDPEKNRTPPILTSPRCWFPVTAPLRAIHRSGKAWSIEHGAIFSIQETWIYRVQIQVEGQRFLGDAVLSLDPERAPAQEREASPLVDAQLRAMDTALLFAGFGGDEDEGLVHPPAADPGPSSSPAEGKSAGGMDLPALQRLVAAQIADVHRLALPFSVESCEIFSLADLLVYRATIQVAQRRFLGDVEMNWLPAPDLATRAQALAGAQLAAVGTALTFAGFPSPTPPVSPAEPAPLPPPVSPAEPAHPTAPMVDPASAISPPTRPPSEPLRADQRDQLARLCRRLDKPEPVYECLSATEADRLLAAYKAEEDELLREAEAAIQVADAGTASHRQKPLVPAAPPPPAPGGMVDASRVRQLKQRWRETFCPAGDAAMQRAQWREFKTRLCGESVSDEAMTPAHYERLLQVLPSTPSRPSSPSVSQAGVSAHQSATSPVRQAPRREPGAPARAPRRK